MHEVAEMSGSYYSANPHYASPDHSDDREHVARCEENAVWFFNQATKAQKAAYDQAMADTRWLRGPRYDRARAAAERTWRESTAAARALYEETLQDLIRDGEVSEETAEKWDALEAAQSAKAAHTAIMSQFDTALRMLRSA
ncbi:MULTISPECIES: hypothetical protein [unclassified Bradyrhizobium]|uniref:hypothetical protein n=1 Tax=unclassified Bradyrhizobium TaxID=2631580 RepID=UPI002916EF93|nr:MULTISPECIES: hypothetical protein [unclassified Bradyrhizobium]